MLGNTAWKKRVDGDRKQLQGQPRTGDALGLSACRHHHRDGKFPVRRGVRPVVAFHSAVPDGGRRAHRCRGRVLAGRGIHRAGDRARCNRAILGRAVGPLWPQDDVPARSHRVVFHYRHVCLHCRALAGGHCAWLAWCLLRLRRSGGGDVERERPRFAVQEKSGPVDSAALPRPVAGPGHRRPADHRLQLPQHHPRLRRADRRRPDLGRARRTGRPHRAQ